MRNFVQHPSGFVEVIDGKDSPVTEEEVTSEVDAGNGTLKQYADSKAAKDKARGKKLLEISALMLAKMDEDITFNAVVYQCNDLSRSNIKGKALGNIIRASRQDQFVTGWIAKDDSVIPMSPTELEDLAFLMEAQYEAALFNANAHKSALAKKTAVTTISGYDCTTGW